MDSVMASPTVFPVLNILDGRNFKLDNACEVLVAAAIQAPSGDNTQPWQFLIDPENRLIAIELDESRDPTPMNSGQRMARLAIGAVVENILQVAGQFDWQVQQVEPPPTAIAAVRILRAERFPESGELPGVIANRVTNRRLYDKRPVPENVIEDLRLVTPDLGGVRTIWIAEPDRLQRIADLIGRSDALMLGEPLMRRGFLDNIRFDLPATAAPDEGLSLGCLEIPRGDQLALRFLPYLPDALFRVLGISGKFVSAAKRLVASSSGIWVVTEDEGTEQKELLAGRAMERAWLKLTELGLATQPMMSLAILESMLVRGSEALLKSLGRGAAERLVAQFHTEVPEIDGANIAFIARFGYAKPPTCRTGRLPIASNTRETGEPCSE